MWLLKKLTDDATLQYLTCEKKCYTVGRKNSDIILNDSSISRTHSLIHIAPKRECPFTVQTHTGVWVIDKKSKYGTYIHRSHEWVRLEEEKVQELSNGTIIRFGLMESVWRLEYKPVIACTSRLSTEQIEEIKLQMAVVDGKLLGKWTKQCNVVIVNDVTLTIKVVLALIHGVPIVTTNYLKKVVENVQKNQPLPDSKEYKPEIKESTLVSHLVSLNPEDNRRELFKGKTFVFPSEEQLQNLREIIEAAGGSVELLQLDGNWRKLSDENVIVIQLPCNKIINPDESAQSFKNLTNVLKNEYHVRVVPESEIYHAIAYSSTEKYCNPKSNEFELRHSSYDQNSCGDIIEEETPTQGGAVEQSTSAGFKEPDPPVCSTTEEGGTPSRKRIHSPEIEERSKRGAFDIPGSSADSPGRSIDISMFCEISNKKQSKTVEVARKDGISNNFENLRITRRSSVKDQQKDDSSLTKRNSNKSSSTKRNRQLDEFWVYDSKKCPREEKRKRKLSGDSTEVKDSDSFEKRKRFDATVDNMSKNCDSIGLKSANDSTSTSTNLIAERIAPTPQQQSRTTLEHVGNESSWHVKKIASESGQESTDPAEIIINVKRFRKKENRTLPTIVHSSESRAEEVGKMLLMQGWHKSQCGRRRVSVADA